MRILALVYEPDAGPGVFAEEIRSRGDELDIWPVPEGEAPADPAGYDAVMSFGGSMHADQVHDHRWLSRQKGLISELLEGGVPFLGVCLGAQLLGEAAGSPSRRLPAPEIGWYDVKVTNDGAADPLFGPLAPRFEGFVWHSYEVPAPREAVALARSAACLQGFRLGERAWGIQFHAEVTGENLGSWIANYGLDGEDRSGYTAEDLRRDAADRLAAWNQLGRELCGRFLEATRA
ncbi:MAG: type 1 glutamine amidotransferase [Solirubrobacterales bacterium]|nr:type 1 glutamine amidotransferase [Solirubrobacterales bacterium]